MVGVPGKSQSCNTCRERKVKCDLRRPFCKRCIAGNLQCAGYERDLVFVNRTLSAPSSTATSVLSEMKKQRKIHYADRSVREQDHYLRLVRLPTSPSPGRLYLSQTVSILKEMYLPLDEWSSFCCPLTCSSWVHFLTDLNGPHEALNMSLTALCMIQAYRLGYDAKLYEESVHLYQGALRKLSGDVENSTSRLQEGTLAATVVLSNYEMFLRQSASGWDAHVQGGSRILQLHGPTRTHTLASRYLIFRLRSFCLLYAARKRCATFLAKPEWRLEATGWKDYYGSVQDIAVDAPALFEASDRFISGCKGPHTAQAGLSILTAYSSVVRRLHSWHDELQKSRSTSLYWAIGSSAHNPADETSGKVFPFALEFPSLHIAKMQQLYWSLLILIYDSMESVQVFMNPTSTSSQYDGEHSDFQNHEFAVSRNGSLDSSQIGQSSISLSIEATKLARYICQSMEYCHRADMGTIGPQVTTFPRWVVHRYFSYRAGHDRELAWIEGIKNMKGPIHRFGAGMTFDFVEDDFYQDGKNQLMA